MTIASSSQLLRGTYSDPELIRAHSLQKAVALPSVNDVRITLRALPNIENLSAK